MASVVADAIERHAEHALRHAQRSKRRFDSIALMEHAPAGKPEARESTIFQGSAEEIHSEFFSGSRRPLAFR